MARGTRPATRFVHAVEGEDADSVTIQSVGMRASRMALCKKELAW